MDEKKEYKKRKNVATFIVIINILFFLYLVNWMPFSTAQPKEHQIISDNSILLSGEELIINRTGIKIYSGEIIGDSSMPIKSGDRVLMLDDFEDIELKIGDWVVFWNNKDTYVGHAIYEIGIDKDGVYYYTKGLNNNHKDNIKLRRADLTALVIGIIK